jgi:hypothetical protein
MVKYLIVAWIACGLLSVLFGAGWVVALPFVILVAGIACIRHGMKELMMGHAPPKGKLGPPRKPPRPPQQPGAELEGEEALERVRGYYLMGRYDAEEFEALVWYVLLGGVITWNGYRAGWSERREADGSTTYRVEGPS